MNPAFQINHFHGTFVFIFNRQMINDLNEQMVVQPEDKISIKEFKRAINKQKVNCKKENGEVMLRSQKFNDSLIINTNTETANDINEILKKYKMTKPHVYAFREKLNDKLKQKNQISKAA